MGRRKRADGLAHSGGRQKSTDRARRLTEIQGILRPLPRLDTTGVLIDLVDHAAHQQAIEDTMRRINWDNFRTDTILHAVQDVAAAYHATAGHPLQMHVLEQIEYCVDVMQALEASINMCQLTAPKSNRSDGTKVLVSSREEQLQQLRSQLHTSSSSNGTFTPAGPRKSAQRYTEPQADLWEKVCRLERDLHAVRCSLTKLASDVSRLSYRISPEQAENERVRDDPTIDVALRIHAAQREAFRVQSGRSSAVQSIGAVSTLHNSSGAPSNAGSVA